MKALHYGEGNVHPHRPPTFAVHTYIREFVEQFPSEMVHILATIPFEIQEG